MRKNNKSNLPLTLHTETVLKLSRPALTRMQLAAVNGGEEPTRCRFTV